MLPDDESFLAPRPRVRLVSLPTPLERALRLEEALRARGAASVPRLYLKRDDLLSLGMGGNKIRNLEFSIGDALARGATDVVTAGRAQSNHCRLTAAACARTGLRAHLVLSGGQPGVESGNLLLDRLLGASVYFAGSDERAAREQLVREVAAGVTRSGGRPYVIPVGGSDARGARGHALAALELARQCEAAAVTPSTIVMATATGGTQAGMLSGFAKLAIDVTIAGFAVARTAEELRATVGAMTEALSEEIGAPPVDAARIIIDGAMLGEGYGVPSAAGWAAIDLLARSEGVFADPVYTGKALAGLVHLVKVRAFSPEECVVFLHTGGAPALFADLAATSL